MLTSVSSSHIIKLNVVCSWKVKLRECIRCCNAGKCSTWNGAQYFHCQWKLNDGLTYLRFMLSQLLLSWIKNANRFHPEQRTGDRGSQETLVGFWSITIPSMKVRVRFIIPDINRTLFVSGVMWLTSRTKMTMTKACMEGKGIDVVINNSTAPPSRGLAYFVISTRR